VCNETPESLSLSQECSSSTILPSITTPTTAVLISNEITNESSPNISFPFATDESKNMLEKVNDNISPKEKDDIKSIIEQVIDQAKQAVVSAEAEKEQQFPEVSQEEISGESKPEIKSTPKISSRAFSLTFDDNNDHDELSQQPPLELEFESFIDPDHPDIKAMYSFLQKPDSTDTNLIPQQQQQEMEIEFIPEVQPQSVPPITLDSCCTNPLKSSILMALTEPPLFVEKSQTELEPETKQIISSPPTILDNSGVGAENCIALNPNIPASTDSELLTQVDEPLLLLLNTTINQQLENNRSAKPNETPFSGDASNTDHQQQVQDKPVSVVNDNNGQQVLKEKAGDEKETGQNL
jgi:hypothetical protein